MSARTLPLTSRRQAAWLTAASGALVAAMHHFDCTTLRELALLLKVEAGPALLDALGLTGDLDALWSTIESIRERVARDMGYYETHLDA